jgi:hypothetical protein
VAKAHETRGEAWKRTGRRERINEETDMRENRERRYIVASMARLFSFLFCPLDDHCAACIAAYFE